MTQVDIVNRFLSRADFNETELLLKTRIVRLDQSLAVARKDFEELSAKTQEKQNEVLAATQQLQALLGLVLEIQNQKDDATQPLEAPQAELVSGE